MDHPIASKTETATPADTDPADAPAADPAVPASAVPDPAAADAATKRDIAALLPELRAFARFLARDRVAADDLVQDALVRALAAASRFERGTNLKAWLFTILRNAFYEQGRRRRREAAVLRAGFPPDAAGRPDQDGRSEVSDLERLIWTLPPLLREALILVGAQELTHEEAAAICGVPEGTMKARLSRARAALARAMATPGPKSGEAGP